VNTLVITIRVVIKAPRFQAAKDGDGQQLRVSMCFLQVIEIPPDDRSVVSVASQQVPGPHDLQRVAVHRFREQRMLDLELVRQNIRGIETRIAFGVSSSAPRFVWRRYSAFANRSLSKGVAPVSNSYKRTPSEQMSDREKIERGANLVCRRCEEAMQC
jgi:hypothetical protein